MNLGRRSFLRGVLTVAVLSAVEPIVRLARSVPRILGDGVHDDAPGLNALFRGHPVDIVGDCARIIRGRGVVLQNGLFRTCSTLVLSREPVFMSGVWVKAEHDGSIFRVEDSMLGGHVIERCRFDGGGFAPRLA